MQNAGDAALATAVEATDQYLVYSFEVDWARNGAYAHALSDLSSVVLTMNVQRDINSSLPAETTIVEGYMAATLQVTVGGTRPGDASPIAKLLSPWNATAPLFGDGRLTIPVRASIGHRVASGTKILIKQFTGLISEFTVDSRTAQVNIRCLDPADTLGAAISLPLWATEKTSVTYPAVGGTIATIDVDDYRTNSQWIIDYVFRRNGYYASPPPMPGCIFAATLHGSLVAEIGTMPFVDSFNSLGVVGPEDPVTWPGRPGWGLAYGGAARYVPVCFTRALPGFFPLAGFSFTVQAQMDLSAPRWPNASGVFLAYGSSSFPFSGDSAGININFSVGDDGRMVCQFFRGNTSVANVVGPLLSTAGYADVWFRVVFGSPLSASSVTFTGNVTVACDLSLINTPARELWANPNITLAPIVPMHDVQVCNSTGLAVGSTIYNVGTWVPQVDLDPGLNDFSGIPLRRGVDSWALLKEVVGAEFGVIGFDENGRPFFKNRDNVRRQNLSVEKVLTDKQLITDMSLSERTGSVRNKITTKIASRRIGAWDDDLSGWEAVFKLANKDSIVAGPGQSIHEITLDKPAWVPNSPASGVFQSSVTNWPPSLGSSSRYACVRQDTGAEQLGVSVAIVVQAASEGFDRIQIIVNNPGIFPIVFADDTGDPALWISGRAYSDTTETDLAYTLASSITRYGERTLELDGRDWYQSERPVGNIARALLKDLRAPLPVVDRLVAVGDCRVQLQDTATVEEQIVLGGPMYTAVTGIQRQLQVDGSTGGTKLTDTYLVRPFAPPGKWILGHPVWGILGQTTKL